MIVRRVSALPYLSLIGDNRNKQADRNLHLMLTITNALCSSLGIGISWDILTPTLVFPQTRKGMGRVSGEGGGGRDELRPNITNYYVCR